MPAVKGVLRPGEEVLGWDCVNEDNASPPRKESSELHKAGDFVLGCGGAGLFAGGLAGIFAHSGAGASVTVSAMIGIAVGFLAAFAIAKSGRAQKLITDLFSIRQ
jgi:hypothetical protein